MNVLITGGTGVNGSWVVRELVSEGINPVIYDYAIDTAMIKDIVDKVKLIRGDILDFATFLRTIKENKITHIIHLAALMPSQAQANPLYGFQVNALGTVLVLEAARIMDVERVVYTSSKAAYGAISGKAAYPTYEPVNEDYPRYPVKVYDVAKVASEGMCHVYNENYGLDYVAFRFASIIGPGKLTRHGPMSIHSKLIENAMLGQPTHIPHGADEKDDMVYVKDIAHAIVLGLKAKNLKHRVFNIGSGKGYTLVDLANVLKKIYPNCQIEIGPGLDYMSAGVPYYCVFDISRAKEELGYEPRYSLEEMVKDYIETMEKMGIEPTYTP